MNRIGLIVAGAVAAVSTIASAQTGVRYQLLPGSQLNEGTCLGACGCAPRHDIRDATGTFTLTFSDHGPLFDNYTVTGVQFTATGASGVSQITGSGTYRIGGEVAVMQQLVLSLSIDGDPALQYDSGLTVIDQSHRFPEIGITAQTALFQLCNQNAVTVIAAPVPCAADCDASGNLNVNDFVCFMSSFAAGDPYANCDGSTSPPTLNVSDFICYQALFAAGCP
jgi:hypothetical protein